MHRLAVPSLVALLAWCAACRVERVSPRGDGAAAATSCSQEPEGELWVYTSIYRHVLDALAPLIAERLPKVRVHWYQAGSEKVSSRLEAEIAAGGTQADLLATSDPFSYERFKRAGMLAPYASPHALRIPRSLVDADAAYVACRLSTMVLVHRRELTSPPESFLSLAEPAWRGRVAIGDPLTSGTAATWASFVEAKYGPDYFESLRRNRAVVAGGNAAVLQKVEGGEADVGVLLLENALAAMGRGSAIAVRYPSDGAVVVPGYLAVFASSRNPVAARALYDLILSPEGQKAIVELGDMHAVDPRLPGPRAQPAVEDLLARSMPWSASFLERGLLRGGAVKTSFSEAFAQ